MNKNEVKKIIKTIDNLVDIGECPKIETPIFVSEQIEHSITKESIENFIRLNSELSIYQIYKSILEPIPSLNPNKHLTLFALNDLLGRESRLSYPDESYNHYKTSYKHMILGKIKGYEQTDVKTFYCEIVCPKNCCENCNVYNGKFFTPEELITNENFPPKICANELRCGIAIMVMSSRLYYKKINSKFDDN